MTDILTVADGQDRLYRNLVTNAANPFTIQTGAAISANVSDVYRVSSDNGMGWSQIVGFNIPKMRVLEEVYVELTVPNVVLDALASEGEVDLNPLSQAALNSAFPNPRSNQGILSALKRDDNVTEEEAVALGGAVAPLRAQLGAGAGKAATAALANAADLNASIPIAHAGAVAAWGRIPFYRIVQQIQVISGGRVVFTLFPDKYDEVVDLVNPDYATRQLIQYLGYEGENAAQNSIDPDPENRKFIYKLKLPMTADTHSMVDMNALRDYLRIEIQTRSADQLTSSLVAMQTMGSRPAAAAILDGRADAAGVVPYHGQTGLKFMQVLPRPRIRGIGEDGGSFDMRLLVKMTTFPQAVSNAYQRQYNQDWAIKCVSPYYYTFSDIRCTPRRLTDHRGEAHAIIPLRALTQLAEQLLIQAHPKAILDAGLRGKEFALPIRRCDLYANGRLISGEFIDQVLRTYQASGQCQLTGVGSTIPNLSADADPDTNPFAVLNFSRYPAMQTAFVGGLALGSLSDAYLHLWFDLPWYFRQKINVRAAGFENKIIEGINGAVSSYPIDGFGIDRGNEAAAKQVHEIYHDEEFLVQVDVCVQATTLMQYRTMGGYGQGELRSTTQI